MIDFIRAQKMIRAAFWAAIVSGVLTAIISLIAAGGTPIAGFSAWNLFDAIFIFGMAYGISKRSRTCAVLMLAYWIANLVIGFIENPGFSGSIPMSLLFAVFYTEGVIGTFTYHKLIKPVTLPSEPPAETSEETADTETVLRPQQPVVAEDGLKPLGSGNYRSM